ncbi:MAG: peptidylprolyl isomerase [Eubacteriales bacterium]
MTKKIVLLFLILLTLSLVSCKQGVSFKKTVSVEGATNFVQLEMTGGGIIVIELYPDIAPISVANFQKLVASGFYDGLIFHRVIKDFMIQCGDPTGTGMGGSDETIKGEFAANGVENNLSHERGVVSMGRKSTGNDTASSHFFICHGDASKLDGSYAAFGRVIEGMDVVDAIASTATNENDKPLTDQVIKKAFFIEK